MYIHLKCVHATFACMCQGFGVEFDLLLICKLHYKFHLVQSNQRINTLIKKTTTYSIILKINNSYNFALIGKQYIN